MTNPNQNATTSTAKGDVERTELDRQEGPEYLPMNVFVDPATMKTGFQQFSIHTRWTLVPAVA